MKKRRKLLIVVDYQNDFVSGSLGFPGAQNLEEGIVSKIKDYHTAEDDVLFTLDTHFDNYLSTQEGKYLPVNHCISQTDGWQLYGAVAAEKAATDVTICKHTFGSLDLIAYLQKGDYDFVELVGVVTNICVIANALIVKTALPEAEVVVDASCVASNDVTLGEKALDVMAGLQIRITNR